MKRVITAARNKLTPVLSSEYFDLFEVSGTGTNNTPWSGYRVKAKGAADDYVIDIRLQNKFVEFDGEPIEYEYTNCQVWYGLGNTGHADSNIREFISLLEAALDFAQQVRDYLGIEE